MELWARGPLGDSVDFLCACVESQTVAKAFGRMFQMERCLNGFIPGSAHMPRGYGQLGCSGFVLVDGQGRFLSKRTQAFLQVGEEAFGDLESVLRVHLQSTPLAGTPQLGSDADNSSGEYPYGVGCVAVVEGLAKEPSLNGRKCRVLGFDPAAGRFRVELLTEGLTAGTGRLLALRPCSLAPFVQTLSARSTPAVAAAAGAPAEVVAPVASISGVKCVGVACMDEEHDRCTDAINDLLAAVRSHEHAVRSQDAAGKRARVSSSEGKVSDASAKKCLAVVLDELGDHFAHEEALMKEHRFGGDGAFGALVGHAADHERILDLARREVDRVAPGESGKASAGGEVAPEVDPEVAWALARAFLEHAEKFDKLYEGQIPASAI
mmetsp:Transcript_11901/g.27900  ORF Transcript_11901/g.27900 Transcript_11901/m.27900 type:complete len:379 (+) Transcript_11901:280-1416(+)